MTTAAVNLLPAYRREARASARRAKLWMTACLALCAGLCFAYASMVRAGSEDRSRLDESVRTATAKAEDLLRQLTTVRSALGESQRRWKAIESITGHPDWSLLLALLGELRADSIMLDRISVRAGEASKGGPGTESYVVRVGGLSGSQQKAYEFVRRLEASALFEAVKVIETRPRPVDKVELVSFDIECRLAPAPRVKAGSAGRAGVVK